MTVFRKRRVFIAAGAIAIAAGIGAATVAAGSAHAQPSGSISITSVGPNSDGEPQFPVVTVSITCPVDDHFNVDATTIQSATSSGSSASTECTGDPQTVTVSTEFPSSSAVYPGDGAGPVFVGATLLFAPPGDLVDTSSGTYIGTTANLTFP
jgi:hypothetical protein